MRRKWRIRSGHEQGRRVFEVYKLIDETGSDQAGNRKVEATFYSRDVAELARELLEQKEEYE